MKLWNVRYITDSTCWNDYAIPRNGLWGASVPYPRLSCRMVKLAVRMWWRGYKISIERQAWDGSNWVVTFRLDNHIKRM